MKKNHSFPMLITCLSLCIISITSCGKKDDDDDASIVGSWKMTTATFNPAYDTDNDPSTPAVTDAYSLLNAQACDQDNLVIFQENGVQIDDEGATKCDPLDPQQKTGTYTLSGSTLTIYNSNDTTSINNVAITSTTLTGKATFDFGPSQAHIDFTFTRQ